MQLNHNQTTGTSQGKQKKSQDMISEIDIEQTKQIEEWNTHFPSPV